MNNENNEIKEILKEAGIPLISGAIGLAIGTMIIVGITKYNAKKDMEVQATRELTLNESLVKELSGEVDENSTKIFDEGEHILSVRVNYRYNNQYVDYAVNNIPEGYEIFDIEPYTIQAGRGSQTQGFDIWFKNTEPVEVHATYNEGYEQYGYFTFGEVVEKEKVLEK